MFLSRSMLLDPFAHPIPAAALFFSQHRRGKALFAQNLEMTLLEVLAADAGPALRLAHLAAAPPQSSSLKVEWSRGLSVCFSQSSSMRCSFGFILHLLEELE